MLGSGASVATLLTFGVCVFGVGDHFISLHAVAEFFGGAEDCGFTGLSP